MDDWSYVALAYAVVWGAIAGYTLMLQRRIAGARAAVESMRQAIDPGSSTVRQQEAVCDAPSAR